MELKEYQKRCLQDVKSYLNSLSDLKTRYESILATDKKLASAIDFPRAAWEEVTDGLQKTRYTSKKNGWIKICDCILSKWAIGFLSFIYDN